MDELYAGKFSAVIEECISNCLQLQLPVCGGFDYHSYYISTGSYKGSESGKENGAVINLIRKMTLDSFE